MLAITPHEIDLVRAAFIEGGMPAAVTELRRLLPGRLNEELAQAWTRDVLGGIPPP